MSNHRTDPKEFISFEIEGRQFETLPTPTFRRRKPYVPHDPKKMQCFIPGIIRKIYVARGWAVQEGESLFMLEAMKMQNDLLAPHEGRVKEVYVKVGDMATKGQILLEFE